MLAGVWTWVRLPPAPLYLKNVENFNVFCYVTISPSRSVRCETNKPPAMRVRVEGYTKKLQTRYNKGVQANCKAKGEKYGTKGS